MYDSKRKRRKSRWVNRSLYELTADRAKLLATTVHKLESDVGGFKSVAKKRRGRIDELNRLISKLYGEIKELRDYPPQVMEVDDERIAALEGTVKKLKGILKWRHEEYVELTEGNTAMILDRNKWRNLAGTRSDKILALEEKVQWWKDCAELRLDAAKENETLRESNKALRASIARRGVAVERRLQALADKDKDIAYWREKATARAWSTAGGDTDINDNS